MDNTRDIHIIIADDHDLYRDGLSALLRQTLGMYVAGEAANGRVLVDLARRLKPDVILADLQMPGIGGIEAIREITALQLPCACVALTNFDTDSLVLDVIAAGARGYVQKSAGREDVLDAVRSVHGGHYYYCRTTSTRLAAIIARSGYHRREQPPASIFSQREKQIIGLICEEKNNEEIGKALFASPRTIERHRAAIMEKTGARTPAGVVIYALRNNLYFLP